MMERAFAAFEALLAPKSCWDPSASAWCAWPQTSARLIALRRAIYPDARGSEAAISELNCTRVPGAQRTGSAGGFLLVLGERRSEAQGSPTREPCQCRAVCRRRRQRSRRSALSAPFAEHSERLAEELQCLVGEVVLVPVLSGRLPFPIKHRHRRHAALDVLLQALEHPLASYCGPLGRGGLELSDALLQFDIF